MRVLGFCGGRKESPKKNLFSPGKKKEEKEKMKNVFSVFPRESGERPSEEGENRQQTQPVYGTGPKSNLDHTGKRRALSQLRHPCGEFENCRGKNIPASCAVIFMSLS